VVVAGGDDGVRLWDAVSGAEIAVLGGQGGVVGAVALGRAGDREVVVAGGDDGVRLWDAVSGAEIACWAGKAAGSMRWRWAGPAIARWWSRAARTGCGCGMR